jgi:integrase
MAREAIGSVTWVADRQKWRAQFGREYLGLYGDQQEAWDVVNAWRDRDQARGPETLRTFAAKWFERRELEGGIKGVRGERSVWLSRVERAPFMDAALRAIKPHMIQAWLAALSKQKVTRVKQRKVGKVKTPERIETGETLSRESVAKALSLVKLCLDDAVVKGKLSSNPARLVKLPKRKQVTRKGEQLIVHLTAREIGKLFALPMTPRVRAVYALAVYAGLRRGEIWGLRWEHVKLDGQKPLVRVRYSYDAEPKSETSVRDVPLLEPARDALRAHLATLDPRPIAGLVFPADGGGCHSATYDCGWSDHKGYRHGPRSKNKKQRVWPGWRSKAGIRDAVTFHALRHTCGCHLVQGTWTPRPLTLLEAKEWLGHSSIGVTERNYAKLVPGNLHDAVRAPKPSPAKDEK